ncbi:hypothetical protein ACT17R_16630 [Sphingopyxis sp. Q841]|uniref:hypothetical protein n=1 Tax=Sphingopyxis sp. Q841 TaxID=3458250 RepID=UPI004035FA00
MINEKPPTAMDLATILGSRSQRRAFVLATVLVLVVGSLLALLVAHNVPETPVWNAFVNLLISVPAAGVFALLSGLYLWYFFSDPSKVLMQSYLFPKDISSSLTELARHGTEYKIFVRTGRHFRASILPIIIEKARTSRAPLRLEVALLDFRNESLCARYSRYRQSASFDRNTWSPGYVRTEIHATILAILTALNENNGLISADLYLSPRLSTFRIEGTADALIVTREDPNDAAYRYHRGQPEFAAYSAELRWVFDESERVVSSSGGVLPVSLSELFGSDVVTASSEIAARAATKAQSPYAS